MLRMVFKKFSVSRPYAQRRHKKESRIFIHLPDTHLLEMMNLLQKRTTVLLLSKFNIKCLCSIARLQSSNIWKLVDVIDEARII